MSAYWRRILGVGGATLALLAFLISRIVNSPEGSIPRSVNIAVTVAIAPVMAGIFVLANWARSRPAHRRRVALEQREGLTWLADVKVDPATLAGLANDEGWVREVRSLALVLDRGDLALFRNPYGTGIRFRPDEISSIEVSRQADAIDWGQFIVTSRTHGYITMTLIGPLWGGYPASEERVSRFVDELNDSLGVTRSDFAAEP